MRFLLIICLTALFIAGCAPQQSTTQTETPSTAVKDDPVDITDLDYQGLPVRIGVQGEEALPVQAVIEAEEDLPVALHMGKGQKLPVELQMGQNQSLPIQVGQKHHSTLPVAITTIDNKAVKVQIATENEAPLAVAFGLPPIPKEAIVPLSIAGAGLFLLILLPCIAAIASMKAARKTQQIAELYLSQIQKESDTPSPGLLSVAEEDQK